MLISKHAKKYHVIDLLLEQLGSDIHAVSGEALHAFVADATRITNLYDGQSSNLEAMPSSRVRPVCCRSKRGRLWLGEARQVFIAAPPSLHTFRCGENRLGAFTRRGPQTCSMLIDLTSKSSNRVLVDMQTWFADPEVLNLEFLIHQGKCAAGTPPTATSATIL